MDLEGCNPDVLGNLGSRCQSFAPLDNSSTCEIIAKRGKYGLRVRRLRPVPVLWIDSGAGLGFSAEKKRDTRKNLADRFAELESA